MISINRKDLPKPNTTCKTCGRQYYVCNKCLKLRTSGLEPWRQDCDCIECYQMYVFLSKDIQEIDQEEYNRALAIELPDEKKLTKESKQKFDEIKKHFSSKDIIKEQPMEQPKVVQHNNYKQDGKNKNTSNSKYLFNNKRR